MNESAIWIRQDIVKASIMGKLGEMLLLFKWHTAIKSDISQMLAVSYPARVFVVLLASMPAIDDQGLAVGVTQCL